MWSRTADSFLAAPHALAKSLPLTLSALQSGTISWQHALVMVDETATLDSAGAAALERHFLDPDAPKPACRPGRGPARPPGLSGLEPPHRCCTGIAGTGRSQDAHPVARGPLRRLAPRRHVYNHRRGRAHSAVNGTQAHRRWRRLLLPGAGGPAGRGSTGNRPHQLPAHQGHADPWTTKPTTSLPGATVAPPGIEPGAAVPKAPQTPAYQSLETRPAHQKRTTRLDFTERPPLQGRAPGLGTTPLATPIKASHQRLGAGDWQRAGGSWTYTAAGSSSPAVSTSAISAGRGTKRTNMALKPGVLDSRATFSLWTRALASGKYAAAQPLAVG